MSEIKTRSMGLSSMALRCLALFFMLLDHSWTALISPHCYWMTCVGRLAFPIFAFLIAEGCVHTSNFKRYALRLGLFALLSEIPFNLFTAGSLINMRSRNVMFTLLLGLLVLRCLLWAAEKKTWGSVLAALSAFVAACVVADLLQVDYGSMGVVTVIMFGMTRHLPYKLLIQAVCLLVINTFVPSRVLTIGSFGFAIQYFAVLSMFFIGLYNGKKGNCGKWLQYGAYAFYPVHLTAVALLRYLFLR